MYLQHHYFVAFAFNWAVTGSRGEISDTLDFQGWFEGSTIQRSLITTLRPAGSR